MIPLGVPVTFPSGVTLKPFVGVEVITAFGLFVVTTGVSPLVYSRPSSAFLLGFAGVAASTFLITFPFNLTSGVGSLAPTPAPLCL